MSECRTNFSRFHATFLLECNRSIKVLFSDRDKRVPGKYSTQFKNGTVENAYDELSAEMDRVLQRRFDNPECPSMEEIKQSNQEMGRIAGNINKARILQRF